MPAPGKTKLIKQSLPPRQEKMSNARGKPGEGMFKLRFDRYIMILYTPRVVYLPVKYSCLYNKYMQLAIERMHGIMLQLNL